MSAQIDIPNLPTAAALTGTELVPVVQNGVTVHTTAGAISIQPTQTQTFLTQTQEASLANSRYLSSGTGISLVDGGAGSFFRVSLSGTALSLQNASTGIVVKDTATTVANRSIAASGAGLSVSNGDGVAGNPTVALSGLPATLANLTGAGFLVLRAGGTSINPRTILGAIGQIAVTNGDGQSSDPTIGLATTAVTPGVYGANSKTLVQTVDAYGRLTANSEVAIAISNGQVSGLGSMSTQSAGAVAITGGSITGITDLAVADGGTGASTAANARVNLLPNYVGNAIKVLSVNAGATDVEWVAAGIGSVTNVSALTLGTTGTDLSSTVANSSTTPVITLNVPTASASNRGALSAADWSTFNAKQPAGTYVNSVSGTAPVVSSGGTTPAISMAAATGSVNGYLTSTDWSTFNGKQPAGAYLAAVDADAPLTGYGTSASHLSIPAATSLVNGYLTSTDWSTFNGKQPSGTYVNSVSGTAPVVSSGGVTPAISMAAATGSVNGYLTSTDWTTFNGKQPAGAYLTAVTADSPIVGSGTSASHLSMPAASASVSGYLSSTDWSTFNGKQAAFGSQTANYIYAAPNGSAGTPSFRAMVVADVPTLNQNTSGSAATLTTSRNIAGVAFNGSADIAIPLANLSDTTIASPVVDQILKYNGVAWVNGNPNSVSGGSGVEFFNATPSIIATGTNNVLPLLTLSQSPVTTAEQTTTTTSINGTIASSAWLSPALARTTIDAGVWDYTVFASASGATTTLTRQIYAALPFVTGTLTTTGTGTTRTATASAGTPFSTSAIVASATNTLASYLQTPQGLYQISARTDDLNVTIIVPSGYANESAVAASVWKLLFGGLTTPSLTTTITQYDITTTQAAFTVTAATKLGGISFVTSTNAGRTVTTTYNGTTRNTHIATPLAVLHNQLGGLQGGTASEQYHLTDAEYVGTGTGVFVRAAAPTFTGTITGISGGTF